MSLTNKSIKEFISLLDSSSATPGGGSASALISVISVSLARMVGHLTIAKKAFQALPTRVQKDFTSSLVALEAIKDEMILLIDKDAESFNSVMAAYRLPRETEDEQKARKAAIEKAMHGATRVPLEIATLSLKAFAYLDVILNYGNLDAITDVGVSVLSLAAATEGALLNVLINLGGLSDDKLVNEYRNKAERIKKETAALKETYLAAVYTKIK